MKDFYHWKRAQVWKEKNVWERGPEKAQGRSWQDRQRWKGREQRKHREAERQQKEQAQQSAAYKDLRDSVSGQQPDQQPTKADILREIRRRVPGDLSERDIHGDWTAYLKKVRGKREEQVRRSDGEREGGAGRKSGENIGAQVP